MLEYRLPEVARLSGREGLELVMPAVLDSLLTLGADAQASHNHLGTFLQSQGLTQAAKQHQAYQWYLAALHDLHGALCQTCHCLGSYPGY